MCQRGRAPSTGRPAAAGRSRSRRPPCAQRRRDRRRCRRRRGRRLCRGSGSGISDLNVVPSACLRSGRGATRAGNIVFVSIWSDAGAARRAAVAVEAIHAAGDDRSAGRHRRLRRGSQDDPLRRRRGAGGNGQGRLAVVGEDGRATRHHVRRRGSLRGAVVIAAAAGSKPQHRGQRSRQDPSSSSLQSSR